MALSATVNAETLTMATLNNGDMITMADCIAVFNKGVIEPVASQLELYQNPANIFVASFIGCAKMNFIKTSKQNDFKAATIGVRSEHITVADDDGIWAGKIGVIEHLESETFLHVTLNIGTGLTVKASGDTPLKYSDTVEITVDDNKVFYFDKACLNISTAVSNLIKILIG